MKQSTPYFDRLQQWSLTWNNNYTATDVQQDITPYDNFSGDINLTGNFTGIYRGTDILDAINEDTESKFISISVKRNSAGYLTGTAAKVPNAGIGGGNLNVPNTGAVTVPFTLDVGFDTVSGQTINVNEFRALPMRARTVT